MTQYRLEEQSAVLSLVAGDITIKARYRFVNPDGKNMGRSDISMVVTQQQSDDLKAILVAVLQATNAEIESETGWTKATDPPPYEGLQT